MKLASIMSFVGLFILSGCMLLRPREDVSLERKASLVKNAAQSVTFFAITKVEENDVEKQTEVANIIINNIDEKVLPIFEQNRENVTLELTVQELLYSVIPVEYKGLVGVALDTLFTYYEFPEVGETLDEEGVVFLEAFFGGVRQGAQFVVEANS